MDFGEIIFAILFIPSALIMAGLAILFLFSLVITWDDLY